MIQDQVGKALKGLWIFSFLFCHSCLCPLRVPQHHVDVHSYSQHVTGCLECKILGHVNSILIKSAFNRELGPKLPQEKGRLGERLCIAVFPICNIFAVTTCDIWTKFCVFSTKNSVQIFVYMIFFVRLFVCRQNQFSA